VDSGTSQPLPPPQLDSTQTIVSDGEPVIKVFAARLHPLFVLGTFGGVGSFIAFQVLFPNPFFPLMVSPFSTSPLTLPGGFNELVLSYFDDFPISYWPRALSIAWLVSS